MAHNGDMWNDLHVAGCNGFPRILQPDYGILKWQRRGSGLSETLPHFQ